MAVCRVPAGLHSRVSLDVGQDGGERFLLAVVSYQPNLSPKPHTASAAAQEYFLERIDAWRVDRNYFFPARTTLRQEDAHGMCPHPSKLSWQLRRS
jgi:hypothetical protein